MKPNLSKATPYGCLLLAAFILLYPVLTHQASFIIYPDNVQQAYPWLNKLAISLHHGYWPLWDANSFGGRSFVGEMQTGIFYPLNIAWCWLFGSASGIDVYYLDLLVVTHYIIALIGMYRVAKIFGLSVIGSITAAGVYTFTGALAGRSGGETCIFFGLALLPWVVYSVAAYYKYNNKLYLLLAGVMAGLQILAGHLEPFFHTMLLVMGVVALQSYKNGRPLLKFLTDSCKIVIPICVIAAILAFPQLYYTHEYIERCYRHVNGGLLIGPGEKVPMVMYAYRFIISVTDISNLFHQHYDFDNDCNSIYLGIMPLALILLYLLYFVRQKVSAEYILLTKCLLVILVIGTLSVLGYQTFFHLILYQIPMVSVLSRQLARYIILISFSASLLAGLGLQHIKLIKESIITPYANKIFFVAALFAINQLYLCVFQSEVVPLQMSVPLLLLFAFLAIITEKTVTPYLSWIAVSIIIIDLFINPVNYQPVTSKFYPTAFYRKDKVIDFLQKSYGHYRVSSRMVHGSFQRFNLGDVYPIQTDLGYGATDDIAYFNFFHYPGISESEKSDFLNVRYILTDVQLDSQYRFVDSTSNWKLYERKNYYPRVYWKTQIGKTGPDIEAENKDNISQISYSDLYQKYLVKTALPDTLIFSENTYPRWRCYDNGRPVPIIPAAIKDYPRVFRSIALNPGQHLIEFRFKPAFHWF